MEESSLAVNSLDIDAIDPGYEGTYVAWEGTGRSRRQVLLSSNPSRRMHVGGYGTKGPGVSIDKLKDWRFLERRASQLASEARDLGKKISSLTSPHTKKGHELHVAGPNDMLVRFSYRGGYTIDSMTNVIKALGKDSNFYGDHVFLPSESGGDEICRLVHRASRMWYAHHRYNAAFHKSIADRISKLQDTNMWWQRGYTDPKVYVIENEGRFHVVSLDSNNRTTWHEGEVVWVGGRTSHSENT